MIWQSGEMAELVESARLEIECTADKQYRGFESHSLRHEVTEACKEQQTLIV